MAAYETGYDDERFQYPVGQSFHCSICLNVFKDPVKCRRNEHLFCRSCITEHLKNHQSCPSCIEPLTVDTLSQAPRTVTNLLAELKIRCDFFERGCGKFVELGNLKSHVRDCGFAPAICPNKGCQLEVNKHDLLHHETAVCEQRRVQCHSCNDIKQEMDIVKLNLAAMNVKFDKNEKTFERIENKVKAVEGNVVTTIQQQLNNHEIVIRQVQGDVVEIKETLNTISKQLEKITQRAWHEVPVEQKHTTSALESATVDSNASDSYLVDSDSSNSYIAADSNSSDSYLVDSFSANSYFGIDSNASDSYIDNVDSNASDSATEDSNAATSATVNVRRPCIGAIINAHSWYPATVNDHDPYSGTANAYNRLSAPVQDQVPMRKEVKKGKKKKREEKKGGKKKKKRKNKNTETSDNM